MCLSLPRQVYEYVPKADVLGNDYLTFLIMHSGRLQRSTVHLLTLCLKRQVQRTAPEPTLLV